MKTVLTPIDFSGASEAVMAEAIDLARAVRGRIVLLTVVQPPIVTSEYAPLLDNLTELLATAERAAAQKLAGLAEQLRRESIPCHTVQRGGSPAMQILDQAQEFAADYIVMGSHGHTALHDLLVGSTTHGVILRARCPVLIVPPKEIRERHEAAVGAARGKRDRTTARAA